jgi:hypothetical protein
MIWREHGAPAVERTDPWDHDAEGATLALAAPERLPSRSCEAVQLARSETWRPAFVDSQPHL